MLSEGCYYVSIRGTAFGWTQMIPIFVTLGCFIASAVSNQAIYFIYSIFLFFPQWTCFCFQYFFQYARPNPICQLYHTWAFPSIETMYIGSIVAAFITYAVFWPVYQSWVTWLCIYILALLPPLVLIYMQYNVWWEVLFSFLFGALCSVAFMLVVRYFMKPNMHYLRLFFPFYLFGYEDNMIKKDQTGKYLQILKALERVDGAISATSER